MAVRLTSAWQPYIYPFVDAAMNSNRTVTLTDVIWRQQPAQKRFRCAANTSLLFAPLLFLAACTSGPHGKPDIPESVSPGWKLSSYQNLPGEAPQCWDAQYSGPGNADVKLCWYKDSTGAFDAVQRTAAEAQAVKFQEGQYFVLVKWNNVAKADLTALIRALQKALHPNQ